MEWGIWGVKCLKISAWSKACSRSWFLTFFLKLACYCSIAWSRSWFLTFLPWSRSCFLSFFLNLSSINSHIRIFFQLSKTSYGKPCIFGNMAIAIIFNTLYASPFSIRDKKVGKAALMLSCVKPIWSKPQLHHK